MRATLTKLDPAPRLREDARRGMPARSRCTPGRTTHRPLTQRRTMLRVWQFLLQILSECPFEVCP